MLVCIKLTQTHRYTLYLFIITWRKTCQRVYMQYLIGSRCVRFLWIHIFVFLIDHQNHFWFRERSVGMLDFKVLLLFSLVIWVHTKRLFSVFYVFPQQRYLVNFLIYRTNVKAVNRYVSGCKEPSSLFIRTWFLCALGIMNSVVIFCFKSFLIMQAKIGDVYD